MDPEIVGYIEKEGPLTKQGHFVKSWKNRHFALYSTENSAALVYYEDAEKTKKLNSLQITADSSVSEIEEIEKDNVPIATFFLTTPGRVLHLFGTKLGLQDWAHTLGAKIHALRYIRSLQILMEKIFKAQSEAKFISVAIGMCVHLQADDATIISLLNHLGYNDSSTISRSELQLFLRRFQPLISETEVDKHAQGVCYKPSSILSLVSQPWFAGFEDGIEQETRFTNEPEGTFAVRFSSSYIGFFAICVKNGKAGCDHYRLMVTPRGYEVEEHISFLTISEVVTYYSLHPLPDSKSKLVHPAGVPQINLTKYLETQLAIIGAASAQPNTVLGAAAAASSSNAPKEGVPQSHRASTMITSPAAIHAANAALGGVQISIVGTTPMSPSFMASSPPPIGQTPASPRAVSPILSSAPVPIAGDVFKPMDIAASAPSQKLQSVSALANLQEIMEPRGWLPIAFSPSVDWSTVKLKEKLGSGGSGMSVYRASVGGLCCAVKVMETAQFRPEQIRHFEEEIAMLRLVSECPHIVKYLHHTVSPSEIRLYMEYLPASLFDIIKQRRASGKHFSAHTITAVSLEIIKGIHYLHSHDPPILMRDIKSANIFVSVGPNEQFVDIKVGDFGVSRQLDSNKAQTFIGTPGYMCPSIIAMKGRKRKPGEIEDPNEGYTVNVDIFAFGMVMYELLALKQPYSREPDIFGLVKKGIKPQLPQLDLRYEELIKLHLDCIAFEPAERPTAKQVLVRLSTLLPKISSNQKQQL